MNPSDVSQKPSTNASGYEGDAAGSTQANTGMAQGLKDTAREKVDQLKSTAAEAAAHVRDQASGMVDEGRTQVADRIGTYGTAVHRSAEALEQDDPNIAWLTHQAADRIDHVADYVRSRDLAQLKHDAEDIARRHPVAFFGGMFVAGLVVGNLLKATQRGSSSSSSQYEDESYPRSENVPVADVPERDPWPASPPAASF